MAIERHAGGSPARALWSPAAIGLGAAGAGVGAVADAPLLAAAGIGVVAYGVGAAVVALLRAGGGRRDRIDPFALGEPWRLRVQAALNAQRRYEEAVRGTREGPLHDRLADIGARIAAGVEECWRIAKQGNALGQGLRTLRVGRLRSDLDRAEAAAGPAEAEADPRVAALRAQLGSAERMEAVAADADARLTLLAARLDEAAARAVELSLGAGTDADVAGLGSEVDEVVDQLESLRLALGEVER